MTTPHESWASVYDIAYEQSFGEFYHDLTGSTIETIEKSAGSDFIAFQTRSSRHAKFLFLR